MKKQLLCIATTSILAPVAVQAQTPAAPASDHTFTGNAQVISDYRFRGISQTFKGPAFQGGFDYAHASGFYLGNWNSNVSGLSYPNGSGIEMDFYGGYKKSIGDFGFDVGYLWYHYPNARVSTGAGDRKLDNQELYVGGSWKFITAKISYSTTNYFGLDGALAQSFFKNRSTGVALADHGGSRGTLYYDLSANYEIIPKLTLGAHIGYTDVKHYSELKYTDYKVGATYDWNGWLLGANIVGTDADKNFYYVSDGINKTKSTGTVGLILSIGKTF